MKTLCYLVVLACTAAACTDLPKSNSNSALLTSFVTLASGVWVEKDYLSEIEKTHSPLKSAEKLEGVVSMIIPETAEKDSLKINASLNNHEGFEFTVYNRSGQQPNQLPTTIPDDTDQTGFYEMNCIVQGSDTILNVIKYNSAKQIAEKKQFTRVARKALNTDPSLGVQLTVNKIIMAGKYQLIDNKNQKTEVIFDQNGNISGYKSFHTYNLITDFNGGPLPGFDQIVFDMDSTVSKTFGIQLDGEKIHLFNTKGDPYEGKYELAQKAFTLQRLR